MFALTRALALSLIALLAACAPGGGGVPPSAINISDSGIFVPSVRASIALGRNPPAPSATQPGQAIELGASAADGADSQTLPSGAGPVRIGGTTFNAPQQLRHEFDFRYFEAAYRFRYFEHDGPLGIELRAGLAHAGLDVKVSSATQQASDSLGAVGISLGGGVVLRLGPRTGVHARVTVFDTGSEDRVSTGTRFELLGTYAFAQNVALRAGYVSWELESDRGGTGNSQSPIKVKFSGPTAGLEVMF